MLLNCPECKKEILNRDSTSCLSCGYPFNDTFIEKLKGYNSETVNQPTLKKSKRNVIVLSFFSVLMLAVFIVFMIRLTGIDNHETGLLTNNAIDFYFNVPDNWIIDKNDSIISIYINSADGERPNILIQTLSSPEYITIDEYWQNAVVFSFEQVFDNVEYKAEEKLTVGGVSAKKYTYITSLSGMNFKTSQIIFIKNNQVYSLTYTAIENTYDTYAEALDTVATTFRFK
jgi:hypothetical protein